MADNTTKTAVKAPKKSWFKGMKSEFKKIIWPDKESLAKESVAVIVISAVLALVIALIDAVVKYYTDETCNAHRGDYDISLKVDLEYENARDIIKDFINRFGYKATKAAQAQERQKMLDKLLEKEIVIPENLPENEQGEDEIVFELNEVMEDVFCKFVIQKSEESTENAEIDFKTESENYKVVVEND